MTETSSDAAAQKKIRPGRTWTGRDYVVPGFNEGYENAPDAEVCIPLMGWLHTETVFNNTDPDEEFFPEGFPIYSNHDRRFRYGIRHGHEEIAGYIGDRKDAVGRTLWITPEKAENHITSATNHDPASLMLGASHLGIFDESVWNNGPEDLGFLLWVQFTGGLKYDHAGEEFDDRIQYRVVAAYLPCDIYGRQGTPMRDLYDALTGGKLDEAMNANWSHELVDQLNADTAAAIGALKASGDPVWAQFEVTWWGQPFPPGGVQNTFGTEYIALHARHLIGTTPTWTQEAYNRCSATYVAASGRPLHPEDQYETPMRREPTG
ncbi:hypothetical protein [Mycobacteroides abscessus]|uniref:hypothetical protein n=1 Tax=Mycobacteroides abscessus TaxID=36809 RepID=UPI000C25CC05|nr:hypothetical protein [Mycobacteroides abscessus]